MHTTHAFHDLDLVQAGEGQSAVNFIQQGSGDPVVLTHGLAASLHDWDDLLPELDQRGYASYALDLLGHGSSTKPVDHSRYTFDAVFDHFATWMDSLPFSTPAILVGHSLGGGVVLQYALRQPQRVRALVLVNPFFDIHQLPAAMRFLFKKRLLNTRLINRTPYRLFRILVDLTSTHYFGLHQQAHSLPERIRIQTALDFSRASAGIYNIPYTLPVLSHQLSQIQQPVLLIWGNKDKTLAPGSFSSLAKMLPNLFAAHSLPICGHVPHQCHPEKFNSLVMDFIRRLAA